jgi:hypothetical protein
MAAPKPIDPDLLNIRSVLGRIAWSEDCWLWIGKIQRDGYGSVAVTIDRSNRRQQSWQAHRVVYTLLVGDIGDLPLDHLCRVRECVNPSHLEPVSHRENTTRSTGPVAEALRARLSGRCVNGHDLALVGEYPQHGGSTCAKCPRDRVRKYQAATREQRTDYQRRRRAELRAKRGAA